MQKLLYHESITSILHKPFVDEIILVSATGKPMKRVPDLIDVWFDSGAMPYAQWHFPFENKEEFEKIFLQILLLKVLTKQEDGFILCMFWLLCYLIVLLIKLL